MTNYNDTAHGLLDHQPLFVKDFAQQELVHPVLHHVGVRVNERARELLKEAQEAQRVYTDSTVDRILTDVEWVRGGHLKVGHDPYLWHAEGGRAIARWYDFAVAAVPEYFEEPAATERLRRFRNLSPEQQSIRDSARTTFADPRATIDRMIEGLKGKVESGLAQKAVRELEYRAEHLDALLYHGARALSERKEGIPFPVLYAMWAIAIDRTFDCQHVFRSTWQEVIPALRQRWAKIVYSEMTDCMGERVRKFGTSFRYLQDRGVQFDSSEDPLEGVMLSEEEFPYSGWLFENVIPQVPGDVINANGLCHWYGGELANLFADLIQFQEELSGRWAFPTDLERNGRGKISLELPEELAEDLTLKGDEKVHVSKTGTNKLGIVFR